MRLSATAINTWATCPYRYYLYRRYKVEKPGKALRNGIKVHELLEGKEVKGVLTQEIQWHYETLDKLRTEEGYTILYPEKAQELEWEGHTIKRIIDAVAFDSKGRRVLIDYKTATSMWSEPYKGYVPQAMGVQSQIYLIPPAVIPDEYEGTWPTEIHYLVSAYRYKSAKVIKYEYNKDDFENFKNLIALFANTAGEDEPVESFPKKHGFLCGYCDFAKMCLKGDKRGYVER